MCTISIGLNFFSTSVSFHVHCKSRQAQAWSVNWDCSRFIGQQPWRLLCLVRSEPICEPIRAGSRAVDQWNGSSQNRGKFPKNNHETYPVFSTQLLVPSISMTTTTILFHLLISGGCGCVGQCGWVCWCCELTLF